MSIAPLPLSVPLPLGAFLVGDADQPGFPGAGEGRAGNGPHVAQDDVAFLVVEIEQLFRVGDGQLGVDQRMPVIRIRHGLGVVQVIVMQHGAPDEGADVDIPMPLFGQGVGGGGDVDAVGIGG